MQLWNEDQGKLMKTERIWESGSTKLTKLSQVKQSTKKEYLLVLKTLLNEIGTKVSKMWVNCPRRQPLGRSYAKKQGDT